MLSNEPQDQSVEQIERKLVKEGWHVFMSGTTAASITKVAEADKIHIVYKAEITSDKAGAVANLLASGVVWKRWRILANTPIVSDFMPPIRCGGNTDVTLSIDGTADCFVSLSGITVEY